jgi:uncharacterized damage-inducible protein DinB
VKAFAYALGLALGAMPVLAAAQAAPNPVADGLRGMEQRYARTLTAALEAFPADKYGYKPTEAQMTVGAIAVHLAEGNDELCANVSGTPAPQRSAVAATAPKDEVLARLRETFQFCESALARVDDSKLNDQVPFFGGRTVTRANLILVTVGDWADHYSQLAIYLRLNGMLPPTAQRRPN